jgi:hypothetical protein
MVGEGRKCKPGIPLTGRSRSHDNTPRAPSDFAFLCLFCDFPDGILSAPALEEKNARAILLPGHSYSYKYGGEVENE